MSSFLTPNRISASLLKTYHIVITLFNVSSATVVIVATELSILWNGVSDVHSIKSAGQTVPLFIGLASFTRVLYIAIRRYVAGETQSINQDPSEWHNGVWRRSALSKCKTQR